MGEYVKDLTGNANPIIKKYAIGATFSNPGILAVNAGAGQAGLQVCTTTAAADVVGITLDTATYGTTQITDGTGTQKYVSVVVNPLAIYRYVMSGGATEGTALSQHTVTTASAGGTAVTTGTTWTGTEFDEGVTWCYSGANVGQFRKITSTSATAGTVTVPFDNAIAVGDIFLRAPYWAPGDQTASGPLSVQFTTNLWQADASIAVATGALVQIYELELHSIAGSGTSKSAVSFMATDHIFRQNT